MDRSFRAIVRRAGKAVADHGMIVAGDRIGLGLSGGKDSLALLHVLQHLRKVAPIGFEVAAITLSMGWDTDFSPIERHCRDMDVPFYLERTRIGQIVLDARREENPCSLCANMKRGALHAAAARLGCNKVALAHHLDDAVETLLMNTLFAGRVTTFSPVTYMSRRDIKVIRPLVYCTEALVQSAADSLGLPVLRSECPVAGKTTRKTMKEMIGAVRANNPRVDDSILSAMRRMWG